MEKKKKKNVEIVGKNGLQILTFSRSLQTGKMSSSSRNGGRQTANAGNVRSRDHLCRSREKNTRCLKGHSQLCDCVDLDASFSHFEKSLPQPEIKVHAEIRFIFRSICLIFNRLLKNMFLSVLLLILWYYFYHIWLKTAFIASLLHAN